MGNAHVPTSVFRPSSFPTPPRGPGAPRAPGGTETKVKTTRARPHRPPSDADGNKTQELTNVCLFPGLLALALALI